jgi:hypothetical protein
MSREPNETVIDEIIATCNGDLRGAVKALLLVNEQLESELLRLHAQQMFGALRPGHALLN